MKRLFFFKLQTGWLFHLSLVKLASVGSLRRGRGAEFLDFKDWSYIVKLKENGCHYTDSILSADSLGKGNRKWPLHHEMFSEARKLSSFSNNLKVDPVSIRSFSTSSPLSLNNIKPVVTYPNADTQKLDILRENKDKSGIYRWVNKKTGKSYVGSATKLSQRFYLYYSLLSLEKILTKSKSHIISALLKYGYSRFTLEILEYCDSKDLIKREQYYIDKLNPEYNILSKAGSRLGSVHTKETRKKMADTSKKIDNYGRFKTGKNNPMFGKPRPEGAGIPSQAIEVIDEKTNKTTIYSSMGEAARALNIPSQSISAYFIKNRTKPFRGQYTFKKL